MPFKSTRPALILSVDIREQLTAIARARLENAQRVERARILLAFADGKSVSEIARDLRVNRPKVERCIDKALEVGPLASLKDLPGRGRPNTIGARDHAWIQSGAAPLWRRLPLTVDHGDVAADAFGKRDSRRSLVQVF